MMDAMVDVFRYHEISESTHRIMNPLSLEKLLLLGDICRIGSDTRLLDLACGKGEMLCLFAEKYGAKGVGIDLHPPFVTAARDRAHDLGVDELITIEEGDAGDLSGVTGSFGIVSCIGATWIGKGLAGTVRLMKPFVAPGGWLLVGEVFWAAPPSAETRLRNEEMQDFADLAGTLGRFEAAEMDLVEMVLASPDDWDRYSASQWLNVSDWLATHPEDPDAAEIRADRDESRRRYLAEERDCMGWGVFVLRPR
jgi:SAM-dependent methyltransferase